MTIADAVRTRRSVKTFTDRPIRRDEIEALLELAVLAPNHRNTWPWGLVVLGPEARRAYGEVKGRHRAAKVDDPEVAREVAARTVATMEALPVIVAFTQKLHPDPGIREEDFATVYMGMQNFLLGAVEMGFGTHVRTGAALEDPVTRKALGVGDEERVVALVELGEPDGSPPDRPRPSASDRTRWLP